METGSFLLFWIALILIAISTVFGLVPALRWTDLLDDFPQSRLIQHCARKIAGTVWV